MISRIRVNPFSAGIDIKCQNLNIYIYIYIYVELVDDPRYHCVYVAMVTGTGAASQWDVEGIPGVRSKQKHRVFPLVNGRTGGYT